MGSGPVLGPRTFPGAAGDPRSSSRAASGLGIRPGQQLPQDARAGAGVSLTMVLLYRSCCKLHKDRRCVQRDALASPVAGKGEALNMCAPC